MRREDPAGIQEGIWFQYRIAHTRDTGGGGEAAGMDGESIRLVESPRGGKNMWKMPPPPCLDPAPLLRASRGGVLSIPGAQSYDLRVNQLLYEG